MQEAARSFCRRLLVVASNRTVGVHLELDSRFVFPHSFSYCSQAICDGLGVEDLASGAVVKDSTNCLSMRIERLPKGEAVGFVFQRWMGEGFPIHRGDIFHAINRLRKLEFNKRALEHKFVSLSKYVLLNIWVMEWVIREKPYRPKELDYSYLLEFTAKLHGVSQGEKLFARVPPEYQNDLLYNNLLISCLGKGAIRLSMDYMKKMRELGLPISHLVFNRLIILHSSPSRRKMIPKILSQMKADKVTPHVSTYNILLKMEANDHNIEGLIRVLSDMKRAQVEANEITYCILANAYAVARQYTVCEEYIESIKKSMTGKNWSTYDVLMILYGYLSKKEALEQTWRSIQDFHHVRTKSFLLAIEAFGRAGEVNRAEEIWLEMKAIKGLKSTEPFNSMISVYCKHGSVDKVSGLFKEMKANGCKPNAITYRNLALGCLKAGMKKEASRTLEMGAKRTTTISVKKSSPWLETTHSLMEIYAEMGDVDSIKPLFEELRRANYTRYTFVYNTLIKAYVKAKLWHPNLLREMILGGARPDAETYSLVQLVEQFQT